VRLHPLPQIAQAATRSEGTGDGREQQEVKVAAFAPAFASPSSPLSQYKKYQSKQGHTRQGEEGLVSESTATRR